MMKEGIKTPTAELADIVLPAATWLEADQVVTVPFVANNVALAQQKIARVGESRPDEEVFVDLARPARHPGRRLGLDRDSPRQDPAEGETHPDPSSSRQRSVRLVVPGRARS